MTANAPGERTRSCATELVCHDCGLRLPLLDHGVALLHQRLVRMPGHDHMKSGGYKVYPQEIERLLAPNCVVLGLPSTYWGEIIAVAAENPAPGWEAAARAAVAGLSPHKRPRFYFAVDALPRNGQGKIVRRQLLARLQADWRLIDGPRPSLAPASHERLT